MDELLSGMINAIFSSDTTSAAELSKSLASYNEATYTLVTNLHATAVIPVSSVIISIILVLELSRNATHIEGDQQMGVKIIAGTMFKSALLIIAAQNSTMFLDAINEVSALIITNIEGFDPPNPQIPAGLAESVKSGSNLDKCGMLVLLFIPFLVAMVAKMVTMVMVVMRFAELYMLSAFVSIPIALLGHPDTKSMGVGYLQRYAATSLQGVALMLAFSLYTPLTQGALKVDLSAGPASGQSSTMWLLSNYPNILFPPVMLVILVMASGRIAKAVVGQ